MPSSKNATAKSSSQLFFPASERLNDLIFLNIDKNLLFMMVRLALHYREGPVQLLDKYGPDHLVRESHLRKGHLGIRARVDFLRKAVGPADDEYNIPAAASHLFLQEGREFD